MPSWGNTFDDGLTRFWWMPSWPRSLHGHLLDLEIGADGETSYRCVECGLRVDELRAEQLATRACAEAPTG